MKEYRYDERYIGSILAQFSKWEEYCEENDYTWGEAFVSQSLYY